MSVPLASSPEVAAVQEARAELDRFRAAAAQIQREKIRAIENERKASADRILMIEQLANEDIARAIQPEVDARARHANATAALTARILNSPAHKLTPVERARPTFPYADVRFECATCPRGRSELGWRAKFPDSIGIIVSVEDAHARHAEIVTQELLRSVRA